MKKETAIAIVLGIFLGSIIAIFLIYSTHRQEIRDKKVINTKSTPTIVNLTNNAAQFEITDPKNNFTQLSDTINIKGRAQKNSLIVVQSKTTEKTVQIKTDSFDIDFPVTFGENTIRVTAYTDLSINDKLLTVYRIQE